MKIQIDTTKKIIKIEEKVNLSELFNLLEQLLPNGLWEDFTLDVNTTVTWSNPIIWRDIIVRPITPIVPTYPTYPQPWITCESTGATSCVNGIFNVEM